MLLQDGDILLGAWMWWLQQLGDIAAGLWTSPCCLVQPGHRPRLAFLIHFWLVH